MKKIFALLLIIFLFSLFAKDAFALKKRVRTPGAVGVAYSSAKLSRGTHSVVVTFRNLTKVKRVEYSLSYTANGIPQGAMGSFVPNGGGDTRDLYFGTCSKGVCTPHYGITNAQLIITTTRTSGATNTKRYTIKRV